MTLEQILKDSPYSLTQFSDKAIAALEQRITEKDGKPSVPCLAEKNKTRLLSGHPEEVVRQLFLDKLIREYGYDRELFEVNAEVTMGSSGKRADIVVYEKERPTQAYIIVELKSPANPTAKEGKKQLESYCKFSGASIGVWTDGKEAEYYFKNENPKTKTTYLEKLSYLPHANSTLSEVLNVRYTVKQLMQNDKLKDRSLKDIILEFEDIVLANAGVDSFEEIFKLLFTKKETIL